MFRYFARFYEKYYVPIYPIALFSYAQPKKEEPSQHQVQFPDFNTLEQISEITNFSVEYLKKLLN